MVTTGLWAVTDGEVYFIYTADKDFGQAVLSVWKYLCAALTTSII